MSSDRTSQLQALLVRIHQGDQTARRELINRAYPRLRRLAAKLLAESFPRLKQQPALIETSDVVNEAALRLYQALEEVTLPTVLDFFRLAAWRMRTILLDLAKRPAPLLEPNTPPDIETIAWPARPPDSETTPGRVAWLKLHEQIEQLPERERAVVDLLFYHTLHEAEAAELLGVSSKTVRRRWLAAKLRLFQALHDTAPGLEGLFHDAQPSQ